MLRSFHEQRHRLSPAEILKPALTGCGVKAVQFANDTRERLRNGGLQCALRETEYDGYEQRYERKDRTIFSDTLS